VFVLELVVVVVAPVVVELDVVDEAALVLVAELNLNFLPSTLTDVAGAFPKLKVTLVAELGTVRVCEVEADNVPCQTVEPAMDTDVQALPVADKEIFGLEDACFISQVDPVDVVLNCLKLAALAFLEDVDLELDLLLLLFLVLLPETLTELLSTLFFVVE